MRGCGFVLVEACCLHPRRAHYALEEGDDSYCQVGAAYELAYAMRDVPYPADSCDSDHDYKAAVRCGRPEHAPLYPHEPHRRIYGHDFIGAAAAVPAGTEGEQ